MYVLICLLTDYCSVSWHWKRFLDSNRQFRYVVWYTVYYTICDTLGNIYYWLNLSSEIISWMMMRMMMMRMMMVMMMIYLSIFVRYGTVGIPVWRIPRSGYNSCFVGTFEFESEFRKWRIRALVAVVGIIISIIRTKMRWGCIYIYIYDSSSSCSWNRISIIRTEMWWGPNGDNK